MKSGVKNYIPIDGAFDKSNIEHIKAIFADPDKEKLLSFIASNNILTEELLLSLEVKNRIRAVREYEEMLDKDLLEKKWQDWFKLNDWVLGSEFVSILDERAVDTKNISDFLMRAYDGFLDIIEIKRPSISLPFWAAHKDHDNYVPSVELTKSNNTINKIYLRG